MIKQAVILFFLLHVFINIFSQKPEESLAGWQRKHPIEKIYLHFDRDNYLAGETAWFKAYLYSEYQPDTISTTLYAELLSDNQKVISRVILPVLEGRTTGQFDLSDTLKTGNYIIRAYTPTMLNLAPGQDSAFIFQRNIFVYGKKNAAEQQVVKQKIIRLEFFPESGNFISGVMNTIAFKATDENGLPIFVSGNIKGDKDEVISPFTTYHDGMGMFDITPEADKKYYAVLDNDSSGQKYPLPKQGNAGIVFRVIPSGKSKFFEILQQGSNTQLTAAYMLGQMQHQVVFRKDFPAGKESITGTVDVSHLSSGIMQITVFNKDNIPLAERLCFVDNGEYIQQAQLKADTVNFSEKGKNIFYLAFKDTVVGSFSVSITDPEYSLYSVRQQNIFSGLLLTSDLKGYVHNPAYYFMNKNDSAETALDLVMMTNGWRRFKWVDLIQTKAVTEKYKDPGFINVSGNINIQDSKRRFASKPFMVFIMGQDSAKAMRMDVTDSNGFFHLDSLMFFGRSRLLFKDIRGKKSDPLQIKLSGDTLTRLYQLPSFNKQWLSAGLLLSKEKESKLGYDFDAISKAEGITLGGVTVKARKKSSLEQLEEKYASGLFSGSSERTIDLVNTEERITDNNIFDYLAYKVPGLSITKDGLDYSIIYRQVASASSMGLIPMTLYLDEIETDASFISAIPADQIAMVKVYSSFVGAVGNGAGGALAIYTKKDADLYNSVSPGDRIIYKGYSVIKEFYSPDYAVDSSLLRKPDSRITLFWNPDIAVKGINVSVPIHFFNNDRTKRFKIVVEGVTIDGKMLMIEKTIGLKAF